LAQDCSISPRQAYRYLEQAHRLKEPVPPAAASFIAELFGIAV
jgi:hypothetical protein